MVSADEVPFCFAGYDALDIRRVVLIPGLTGWRSNSAMGKMLALSFEPKRSVGLPLRLPRGGKKTMAEFEIRVEGTRGPTWQEDIALANEAAARHEAALLLSQLIRDEAAALSDSAALKVTVIDKATGRSFILELSARTEEAADSTSRVSALRISADEDPLRVEAVV